MADKWSIEIRRTLTVDADDLFTEFVSEWEDAERRGLTRDQFIRETLEILGDECDLYTEVNDEMEFERA